jgi:hypothetical protein
MSPGKGHWSRVAPALQRHPTMAASGKARPRRQLRITPTGDRHRLGGATTVARLHACKTWTAGVQPPGGGRSQAVATWPPSRRATINLSDPSMFDARANGYYLATAARRPSCPDTVGGRSPSHAPASIASSTIGIVGVCASASVLHMLSPTQPVPVAQRVASARIGVPPWLGLGDVRRGRSASVSL